MAMVSQREFLLYTTPMLAFCGGRSYSSCSKQHLCRATKRSLLLPWPGGGQGERNTCAPRKSGTKQGDFPVRHEEIAVAGRRPRVSHCTICIPPLAPAAISPLYYQFDPPSRNNTKTRALSGRESVRDAITIPNMDDLRISPRGRVPLLLRFSRPTHLLKSPARPRSLSLSLSLIFSSPPLNPLLLVPRPTGFRG